MKKSLSSSIKSKSKVLVCDKGADITLSAQVAPGPLDIATKHDKYEGQIWKLNESNVSCVQYVRNLTLGVSSV